MAFALSRVYCRLHFTAFGLLFVFHSHFLDKFIGESCCWNTLAPYLCGYLMLFIYLYTHLMRVVQCALNHVSDEIFRHFGPILYSYESDCSRKTEHCIPFATKWFRLLVSASERVQTDIFLWTIKCGPIRTASKR